MKLISTIFLRGMILLAGAAVLILCISWLPSMAEKAAAQNPEYAYMKYPLLVGIYLTALPFYAALFHGFRLAGSLKEKGFFSTASLGSLRQIQYAGFLIAAAYFLGLVYLISQNAGHPGIVLMGMAIVLISLIAGFFAIFLRQAVLSVSKEPV